MAGNNDNLIPPKKGEVRNPNGRPKGIPNSKTRLRRLLELTQDLKNPVTGEVEGFSVMEQIDMKLIQQARAGNLKAIGLLLDRLEGKPTQTINADITNNPARDILRGAGLLGGEDDRQTAGDLKESPDTETQV